MTSNEYKAKDLFVFSKEICEQDSEFFMRSLDIGSPYTNMLHEANVYIWSNTRFENTEKVESCNIE